MNLKMGPDETMKRGWIKWRRAGRGSSMGDEEGRRRKIKRKTTTVG